MYDTTLGAQEIFGIFLGRVGDKRSYLEPLLKIHDRRVVFVDPTFYV